MNFISSHTTDLNTQQASAITAVQDQIARLNDAVARAVDAGLIVEVTRGSRHHSPQRGWGDQMRISVSKV